MTPKKKQFHREGMTIFHARRAGEQLLQRVQVERKAVLALTRDELAVLAKQMIEVSAIAERQHLAIATVGSVAPEAFPQADGD